MDDDGTHENVAGKSITIDIVPPSPVIIGPNSVYQGVTYTLSLAATGPNPILCWEIDWGDDNTESFDGGISSVTHTFMDPGVYSIVASAVNAYAAYDATPKQVTVLAVIPAASAVTSDITSEGQFVSEFTVTYTDLLGIDPDSLDFEDILVTGPNGFSELAELVTYELSLDGKSCTATYQVYSPGEEWAYADNGVYTLSMQDGQVANTVGQTVPPTTLATFSVVVPQGDITPPVASSLAAVDKVTGGSAALTFTVTYTDDTAITDLGFGDENILVTGPKDYRQFAQYLSSTISEDGKSAVATYRIIAPGGFWDNTDNGTYTFQLQEDQICDDAGNFTAAANLGVAVAKLAPDRIGTSLKKPTNVRLAANGVASTYYGYVMGTNTQDYYRFTTTKASRITAQISNLVDKAQVQILNSKGKTIKPSTTETAGGTYFTAKLPAGTYFMRVVLKGKKGTGYTAKLAAASTAAALRASKLAFSTTPLLPATSTLAPASSLVLGRLALRAADLFSTTSTI